MLRDIASGYRGGGKQCSLVKLCICKGLQVKYRGCKDGEGARQSCLREANRQHPVEHAQGLVGNV
eukprot:9089663-Pyramimonas_sp.AAC.2